jgi:hypothetical protein
MPFVTLPGVTGKFYVPENNPDKTKKHPCPDCFSCQTCGEDRCRICRKSRKAECENDPAGIRKQIANFEID